MLVSLREISNLYSKELTPVRVVDILFDADRDEISHLVCQQGLFPFSREILVAPENIGTAQDIFRGTLFQLNLERKELKDARDRREIETFFDQAKRNFSSRVGFENQFDFVLDVQPEEKKGESDHSSNQSHLLSYRSMKDFFVESPDHVFGQFYDLVVDSADWKMRYLVVNTAAGLGKQLKAIPYRFLKRVAWISGVLQVNLRGKSIDQLVDYPGTLFIDVEEGMEGHKRASGGDIFFPGEFL